MGLQQALNYGIRPGLSVDNGTAYSIDLFGEMHAALVLQRWAAHGASKRGEAVPPRLTVRDMLEFATVRGAQNAALAHKIGTLTPGKALHVATADRIKCIYKHDRQGAGHLLAKRTSGASATNSAAYLR